MKKLLLLGIIGLILSTNACSKVDTELSNDSEYEYNTHYSIGGIYTQWVYWRESNYDDKPDTGYIAGTARPIDDIGIHINLMDDSEFIPDIPVDGTDADISYAYKKKNTPHYEIVGKMTFRCAGYNQPSGGITISMDEDWQYAYGQFEDMNGRTIFRIIELYDEIPE